LIWSFYGLIFTLLAWRFLYQRGYVSEFIVALVVCSALTVYQWNQFVRRTYGQRVEKKAQLALEKVILGSRNALISQGVALPYGGDADAVIYLDGVKFNIEIKSLESPKKVTSKHVEQARKAGNTLFSIPIIWLPRAKCSEAREKSGIRIFAGDARSMMKYLASIK
jgi:hypothetical protein